MNEMEDTSKTKKYHQRFQDMLKELYRVGLRPNELLDMYLKARHDNSFNGDEGRLFDSLEEKTRERVIYMEETYIKPMMIRKLS